MATVLGDAPTLVAKLGIVVAVDEDAIAVEQDEGVVVMPFLEATDEDASDTSPDRRWKINRMRQNHDQCCNSYQTGKTDKLC